MAQQGTRMLGRILLVVVLLVGLALALHLTGMGLHGMSMAGACLAVLQAVFFGFALALLTVRPSLGVSAAPLSSVASPAAPQPTGRYPPDEGTVLRI